MATVYIYGLKCPIAGVVRYIGKSIDPQRRLKQHIKDARGKRYRYYATHWLRKLLAARLVPELVIIRILQDGENWQEVEREVIAQYKAEGMPLVNTAIGGEGVEWLDKEAYARHLEKQRTFLKELYGTPEKKTEQAERSRAQWADPEKRQKMIDALRLNGASPEYRRKMSEIGKLSHSGEEYKRGASVRAKLQRSDPEKEAALLRAFREAQPKRRESILRTTATPEYKVMRARVNKEINARPETSAAKSASMTARWKDPATASRLRAGISNPETRKKMSAGMKRSRSTPEARAGLSMRAKEINERPGFRTAKSQRMKQWWTKGDNKKRLSTSMSKYLLTIDGRTQTVIEWSRESGIKRSTIYARLRQGMDARSAVFMPACDHAAAARVAAINHKTPEYRAKISAILKATFAKRRQS